MGRYRVAGPRRTDLARGLVESPEQVRERVDRVLELVGSLAGPSLLVSHGKVLRALTARWLGAEIPLGNLLPLDPAAISLLQREGSRPLLRLWNLTPSLVRAESLVEAMAVGSAPDPSSITKKSANVKSPMISTPKKWPTSTFRKDESFPPISFGSASASY